MDSDKGNPNNTRSTYLGIPQAQGGSAGTAKNAIPRQGGNARSTYLGIQPGAPGTGPQSTYLAVGGGPAGGPGSAATAKRNDDDYFGIPSGQSAPQASPAPAQAPAAPAPPRISGQSMYLSVGNAGGVDSGTRSVYLGTPGTGAAPKIVGSGGGGGGSNARSCYLGVGQSTGSGTTSCYFGVGQTGGQAAPASADPTQRAFNEPEKVEPQSAPAAPPASPAPDAAASEQSEKATEKSTDKPYDFSKPIRITGFTITFKAECQKCKTVQDLNIKHESGKPGPEVFTTPSEQ